MTNIDLLQLTVNSFHSQIEHLDSEITNLALQTESYKNARSSMLASVSVLESRIAELEAEQPEQLELELEEPYDCGLRLPDFKPSDSFDYEFGDVELGAACALDGEECESCQ